MRLIDADALMENLEELYSKREKDAFFIGNRGPSVTWNDAVALIKSAPTVDVPDITVGEWIVNGLELIEKYTTLIYGQRGGDAE